TGAVDLHLPVGGGHDQQVGKHDSPAVAVLDHPGVRHQVTAAVALALPAGPDELDDPVAPAEPGHRGAVGHHGVDHGDVGEAAAAGVEVALVDRSAVLVEHVEHGGHVTHRGASTPRPAGSSGPW